MRIGLTMAVLSALTIPSGAFAQSVTGGIEGQVLDQLSGAPVTLAKVTVSGANLQIPLITVSRSDGFFTVTEVPVGLYSLSVQHVGYHKVTFADVSIRLGRTTSLGTVPLSTAAAVMDTIVVAVARTPMLDLSTAESGNNLSAQVLDRLPTPRDYREAVAYVPDANTSFLGDATNIAGSTGSENQYFIEGVNVTDPFLGSNGTRLPQNFVREIQIKRGGYEAEYGKATGGIINVITHSGSNEFKGQAFGFFSNNNFSSDSRRGVAAFEQDGYTFYDFGASFGGPLVRDKLWYFAAYNPTFRSESLLLPGLAPFDDKTVSHLFAGKLTWSPDARTTLDLVTFGDPTHHDRVGGNVLVTPLETIANPDPLLSDMTTGAVTANLSGHRRFGDNVIVDASVSRVETSNEARPATEVGRTEITYVDNYNNVLSGGNQNQYDHHAVRWTTDAAATLFAGRHEVKVGAAYENILLDEEWKVQTPDGRDGIVVRSAVDDWLSTTLLNDFRVSHRLPSAFVQDSWRITDRLRANAGLRWDGIYIVNPEGRVLQSINDGWAPRAGTTYQLDQDGRQKLSGSYGRFYEQLPMIASSWYFGDYYQTIDYYHENPLPDFTATPYLSVLADNSTYRSDDLKGQYLDEFTLGYERRLGESWKAGVRGIHRTLGEAIEVSVLPDYSFVLGNPGKGRMSNLPDPVRRYSALEFSLENTFGRKLYLASSYVLSRSYGNYPGVYNTDADNPHSHVANQFIDPAQISEGLLPNDRTHVFKLYGSYAFDSGLTAGWFLTWQSGTPLCEYGGTVFGPKIYSHIVPRGTAGRTPSIWDANLRLSYDISRVMGNVGGARSRLRLDIFHLFGQRQVVDIDQVHYFVLDSEGKQAGLNPNYGKALAYQPPMTVRLGIESSF